METTEIFKRMLNWICENVEGMNNQTDVARKAELNPVSVSRIMTGKTRRVKLETLRALNNAFGNVFNPEWLRGESDVMLAEDLARVSVDQHTSTPPALDATTAALLAAKDEIIAAKEDVIASLKRELSGKDETIAAKDALISSKDALIKTLQQQIETLRLQSAIEKGLSEDGTFLSELAKKMGVKPYANK